MFRQLLIALSLLLPGLSVAESSAPRVAEAFRLKWSAPAGCPSEQAVSDETRRLLSESKRAADPKLLDVQAQVTSSIRGFSLELRLGSGAAPRVRSLVAPTCDELARAAALVVALAIDPLLQPSANSALTSAAGTDGAGVVAEPASAPCPEPALLKCPPLPISSSRTPPPPGSYSSCPVCAASEVPPGRSEQAVLGRSEQYLLLAGSSVAFGALPRALPRVNLGAAHRSGAHWLALSFDLSFASAGPRARGEGAHFVLALAAPRYCARSRLGSATVAACGLVEIGAASATGFGVERPRTRWSPWLSPGAGIEAGVSLPGGGELLLAADLLAVALRTRFELDGGLLFQPNLLVPAARLTLATGI